MSNPSSLIGRSMVIYRRSALHNAFTGAILARVLGFFVGRGRKKIIHEIDAIKFELDLEEIIDSSLYFSNTFEPKIESWIKKNLKPGMNVLDIGANIGYHSFRMASLVRPGGMVYAIEPTSNAFGKLMRNASLNPDLSNIEFIKIGLADTDLGEQEIAFQSSYKLSGKNEVEIERIQLITLDSLIKERNIKHLDFIKMDVDGFEGRVFKGSKETIQRFRPVLAFEITPSETAKLNVNIFEIITFLKELNYTFFNEDEELIPDLEKESSQLSAGFSLNILAKIDNFRN